jgi:apolipoprotein N-acyltransferase
MVVWTVTYNIGVHLYLPLSSAIGIEMAEENRVGKRLGQNTGLNAAASIFGFFIVWYGVSHLNLGYKGIFVLAALACLAAAFCLLSMKPLQNRDLQTRLLFKKKYILYYLFTVLFGARKQILVTFGPWVLIEIFGQPVTTFALLGLTGTALAVFFGQC